MAGGGGEGSEYEVNINLTALLDVLTNLLFFLMFGMAAQQVNMELEGGMELPPSSSEAQPPKTVQISISRRDVRVEKEPVVDLRNGHVAGFNNDEGRIDPLYQRLQTLRNNARAPAKKEDADVLLLFCDKDTPYGLMHQVMNTAAEAGYPKFRMAVLME